MTVSPAAKPAAELPVGAQALNWRRNLLWLWIVNALTQFGVYSAIPFIPLYLQRELGVHDPRQIAFWVGLSGSAIGVSLILTGPVWGRIADRSGRKSMALRATGVGGLFVAAAALVQTPLQLVGVRFLTGSVAGNQSAITALIGSETPDSEVGRALGLIGSATAVGRAMGPLFGALLVTWIGLRYQFALAGLLMCAAVIPLTFLVGETDRRSEPSRSLSLRQLLRAAPASNLRMAGLLLVAQAIANVANFTAVQFLGVKIIETVSTNPGWFTALAFTASGACTAVGALSYSFVVARVGYRPVAATATALFGVGVAAIALGRNPLEIVIAAGLMGTVFGACVPALNSMIGLESPEPLRATVFGVGNSLMGIALVMVPALAGFVAATIDVSTALLGVAGGTVLCAIALFLFTREPQLTGH
jgi:DHA1 family multidrug resistance protein-like MFS transporter